MSRCASRVARQPRYLAKRLSKSREKLQKRLLFSFFLGGGARDGKNGKENRENGENGENRENKENKEFREALSN